MYLVLRRGAIGTLERAGELAGAAAVRCVRELGDDPAFAAWHDRPRKVCLRARNAAQWDAVRAGLRRSLVFERASPAEFPSAISVDSSTNLQIYKSTNRQIDKSTSRQIYKSTGLPVLRGDTPAPARRGG